MRRRASFLLSNRSVPPSFFFLWLFLAAGTKAGRERPGSWRVPGCFLLSNRSNVDTLRSALLRFLEHNGLRHHGSTRTPEGLEAIDEETGEFLAVKQVKC